jgi:hypothetical protein
MYPKLKYLLKISNSHYISLLVSYLRNFTLLSIILDEVRLAPEVEVGAGFGFESLGIRTEAGFRRRQVSTSLSMVILLRQLQQLYFINGTLLLADLSPLR